MRHSRDADVVIVSVLVGILHVIPARDLPVVAT
jgi:hypothetical protein